MRLPKKTPNRFPAPLSIIEGPVVHIHAHKLVRQIFPHVTGILQRVLNRGGAMLEAEANARGQDIRNRFSRRRVKSLMNHIAAERKRQALVLTPPPNPEI